MIRRLSTRDLDEVVRVLGSGGVVAVPTDTVYGVAAPLGDAAAVARLFTLKNRPVTVALPVLVRDVASAAALGVEITLGARALADAFWPGPLTLVLAAPMELARRVGSESATLGVRVAADDVLSALLESTGPLAVTSANAHGEPPCHDADEVLAAFSGAGELDAVLDAGPRTGEVSTVVEISGTRWRVLRAGAVSSAAIEQVMTTPPDSPLEP